MRASALAPSRRPTARCLPLSHATSVPVPPAAPLAPPWDTEDRIRQVLDRDRTPPQMRKDSEGDRIRADLDAEYDQWLPSHIGELDLIGFGILCWYVCV